MDRRTGRLAFGAVILGLVTLAGSLWWESSPGDRGRSGTVLAFSRETSVAGGAAATAHTEQRLEAAASPPSDSTPALPGGDSPPPSDAPEPAAFVSPSPVAFIDAEPTLSELRRLRAELGARQLELVNRLTKAGRYEVVALQEPGTPFVQAPVPDDVLSSWDFVSVGAITEIRRVDLTEAEFPELFDLRRRVEAIQARLEEDPDSDG